MEDNETPAIGYVPTHWQDEPEDGAGSPTPIDAEHLNNMERGITGAYPQPGQIWMSSLPANPASIFGGTWEVMPDTHLTIGAYIYTRMA